MRWENLASRISGRWVAPLFLLVAGVMALAVHYTFQRSEISEQVTASEAKRLRERLSVEQVRINLQFGLDNPLMVRRLVSELALHEGVQRAYLIDRNQRVEASLLRSELAQDVGTLLVPDAYPDLAMLRLLGGERLTSIQVMPVDDQPWLVGLVPIQGERWLLVASDLGVPLTTRMVGLERDLMREGSLMLVAVALLAWLLHVLWFHRAIRLADALQQMGTGNLDVRTGLSGRDELALIGQTADLMAEKLKRTVDRLEHVNRLVNASPVVVVEWVSRPKWEVSYVSDSVKQWGYTPETWLSQVGTQYLGIVHPGDIPQLRHQMHIHLKHGPDDFEVEARVMCSDGRWADVESRVSMDRDATGWVTSLSAIVLDVSRRKESERERREQQELLRLFFDLPFIGMCITEPVERKLVQVNDRFCEIMGYSRDELLNMSWVSITHPDDRSNSLRMSSELYAGKREGYHLRKRYVKKDGRIVDAETDVKAVRDSDGCLRYTMTTVEDVTDRVRKDQELREAKDELERRVVERTRELTEANRELESFSYTVSHDLKSPLRGIEGYSQLLLEMYGDQLDDTGKSYLQRIRRGVIRMAQLIQDLLDYSRLDRREIEQQPVDLQALVVDLLTQVHGETDRYGTHVINRMEPMMVVSADREGLAVALRNLIGNAIKFSSQSAAPVMEVGASRVGNSVRIWVRDNGVGFDMKYHDKVFGIFQRLHPMDEYPGTGVGLALVAKAMHRMGGRAWAESTPGKGATFFLELPEA